MGLEYDRRRREDKHPVVKKLVNIWLGICSLAAAGTSVFLMFGFDFKTPATWLEENTNATNRVNLRVAEVENRVQVIENIMIILARDACNRLTRQQLLLTPQCDVYIFPSRVR